MKTQDGNEGDARCNDASSWDEANFVSKYFLYYMWPLLWRGEKSLGLNDQEVPPSHARADILSDRLEQNYKRELRSGRQSCFLRAILRTFGPELFKVGLLDIIARCLWQLLVLIAMGWLIRDVAKYLELARLGTESVMNEPLASKSNGTISNSDQQVKIDHIFTQLIWDTSLVIISSWLVNLFRHPYLLKSYYVGLKCRVAATNMVYKKSLRLSQESLNLATTGRLTNMLSNDVNRFELASSNAINLITGPLQTILVVVVLYFYIGFIPTIACLSSILLLNMIQTAMGRGFAKFRLLTTLRSDERIRIINELIVGIRIIKMYAWEEHLKKQVEAARQREMSMISLTATLSALNITIFLVSFIITCFASLVTYILLGHQVDPELVFVTIGLCRTIRFPVMYYFPTAVAVTAETIVSCDRIDKFLLLPEHEISSIGYKQSITGPDENGPAKSALSFDKVTASWSTNKDKDPSQLTSVLRNLSLELNPSELLFVIGRVGAGKSSLLMSILGELPILSGVLQINGKLSYSSQEAWIFPGSVRDNILFGNAHEPDRYESVIKACSLIRDLEILPYGDKTLVGERGVSLSGGQKARINLARSLYQEADIYLLDDPLSAVDPPVARDIFRNAIQGFLRNKCVVLATHQLQFVPNATRLLVLDPNNAPTFGTVDQVYHSDSFKQLGFSPGTFSNGEDDESESDRSAGNALTRKPGFLADNLGSLRRRLFLGKHLAGNHSRGPLPISKFNSHEPDEDYEARQIGREKLMDIGNNLSSYKYYLNSSASCFILVWFIVITVVSQSLIQYTDVFLGFWADSARRRGLEGKQFKKIRYTDYLTQNELIGIFSGILVLTTITCVIRTLRFYSITLKASTSIHKRFFASIVAAPTKFFDFNPIGILLNRLGRDIGIIDGLLPQTFSDVYVTILNVLGPIVMSIYVSPWNIGPSFLLIAFSLVVRAKLSKIIIKLKGLEGIRGAPIFTHLSVTLNGLTTIRAFKTNQQFMSKCEHLLDSLSAVSFLYLGAAQLMSFMIANLSLIYCTVVIFTAVFPISKLDSPSTIGLIISQVIIIPFPTQWAIRLLVEAESQMTSVARVKDYSDLEPEEAAIISGDECQLKAIGHQPEGQIKFVGLSLRYFQDEPYVLHDINLEIKQGEKIGVVGRTGAGKSSIISALFRLYPFEGRIEIGGRDTNSMSLHRLRSSISIIPQDPVLFAGSIRKNLDPFSNHTDEELWNALEVVQLKPYFMATSFKLDHQLQESGANLSVGQRQLICLARAIIRQNRILVLDEATANVDPETDAFIQKTIQTQFADCTVITIAHRLITIANSDRVLVLDQGEVREFDEPFKLLRNKAGIFRQLVESSRKHQAARIKIAVKQAYQRRHRSSQ